MSYNKSIYIFHRSLRLDDNIGLLNALRESNHVIPIFVFTPEQITKSNKFRSLFAISFMLQALNDLDENLRKLKSKLYIFYGKQHDVLQNILEQDYDIESVFVNRDYTPYSIDREKKLKKVTEDVKSLNRKVILESYEDYLLHNINDIKTKSGSFYSVFTPFYQESIKHDVPKPKKILRENFISSRYVLKGETSFDKIRGIIEKEGKYELPDSVPEFSATRDEALDRIKKLSLHKKYADNRDTLTLETTRLSPYIKFGLVSIREVYHRIKNLFGIEHDLIRQLYWREFYYNLSYNRQDILKDSTSFRESYDKIYWVNVKDNRDLLEKWKKGETGYPVVDAGMRELNTTGYMHNRTRLITSNFLVKHLFIDWREGEKYFSSKLVDYDPSVNNGNWQFTSGSGADSQPFFRMMNPWTQGERHDPKCAYIKAWIPELENVPNEDIHNWQEKYKEYSHIMYPKPCKIYDYNKLKKESMKVYSKAFK